MKETESTDGKLELEGVFDLFCRVFDDTPTEILYIIVLIDGIFLSGFCLLFLSLLLFWCSRTSPLVGSMRWPWLGGGG
jgi:hypothetical protein